MMLRIVLLFLLVMVVVALLRGPGLRRGSKLSGTFHADGQRQFWNISGYENTVVVELVDERFSRLVLSLDDPAQQAAAITARAGAR